MIPYIKSDEQVIVTKDDSGELVYVVQKKKMEFDEFVENAIRTENLVVPLNMNQQSLSIIIDSFISLGNVLDQIKKNSFYGREFNEQLIEENLANAMEFVEDLDFFWNSDKKHTITSDETESRVLHGIIGCTTEVVELLEAVNKSILVEEPLDRTNVLEECADLLWYIAIIFNTLGANPSNVMETVINKLKERYPDKFTSEAAINRDVVAERKILEEGFK